MHFTQVNDPIFSCDRCHVALTERQRRYYPGSTRIANQPEMHVCVPCETKLTCEAWDACNIPPVAAGPADQNRGTGLPQSGGSQIQRKPAEAVQAIEAAEDLYGVY